MIRLDVRVRYTADVTADPDPVNGADHVVVARSTILVGWMRWRDDHAPMHTALVKWEHFEAFGQYDGEWGPRP